jgi:hypothetical protein
MGRARQSGNEIAPAPSNKVAGAGRRLCDDRHTRLSFPLPKRAPTLTTSPEFTPPQSAPSEAPPVDYQAAPPAPAGRPTSVTVIAGIGIALGALGLLFKPCGVAMQFVPMPGPPNPMLSAMRDDPVILGWSVISGSTGTLLSLLLLLSSIGCLGLKPWARTGMLAYAALAILMTFITQAIGYFVVGPAVENAVRSAGVQQPPGMAWMDGMVGVAIGLLIGLWYPVLILFYFTRQRVKDAFAQGLPGTGI